MEKLGIIKDMEDFEKDKIWLISMFLFLLNIILLFSLFFLLYYIYVNYSEIEKNLSILYNLNDIFKLLVNNKELLLGFILYMVLLGYIKGKKGLIFENLLNQGNFIYGIVIIRNSISILSSIYLYYLYGNNIKEFFFFLIIFLFNGLTLILLNLYISIKSDYSLMLNIINKKNHRFFAYNFNFLFFFIDFLIIYSFFVIYLGISNSFNFITILYSHIVIIIGYAIFNILNNGFIKKLVCIKINGKIMKDILIYDMNDTTYFIKTKKDSLVIEKSNIEYIKIN